MTGRSRHAALPPRRPRPLLRIRIGSKTDPTGHVIDPPTYPPRGAAPMTALNTRNLCRVLLSLAVLCGAALVSIGCGKPKSTDKGGPIPLKVAYLGLTCEAPIFVAEER